MHLRTLELFCSVAEFRSFSRAAVEHSLTQSAVSQAIQQVEEVVGAQLIDRSRRPLCLTRAGEVYLAGVQKLLRGYRRVEQDVRSLAGRIAGRLTIGAIYSIGSTYMPAAREEFRRRHGDIELRFEYGSSECVAGMVESGQVDIGLISYPKNTRKVRFVSWLQEPMRVICAAGHPLVDCGEIELSQIRGWELVGFDPALKIRRVVDAFLTRHGVAADVTMEFDNIDSMIRAVQANVGLTILPESTVRQECADGSLRVVACRQMNLSRPLGILHRRSGKLSPAAAEFTNLLLGRPIDAAASKSSPRRDGAVAADGEASAESHSWSDPAAGTPADSPPRSSVFA